ncbi:MAG: type II toxin-antitoxin system PemK/MazF family toxin [Methanolobus sp.]|uniref:type II toxin-antitoxin system PemK/MazF family toxin n=1 Tax=Methanolobus sp. TaxID=1874737 RepID=UPI00272FB8E9|nr:type II toxin-antitoxin system PemK/MazF family toxin [Methanolobus sp.]MDP2216152.1 type II toxin-antitoxin system PemK/MazF family toxin [Methanolobus sp.]
MVTFKKGSIVVLPFPFSDLTATKRRPALVIVDLNGDDYVLCQITSNHMHDSYEVTLGKNDLIKGTLKTDSLVRTNKIFTATGDIIEYELGILSEKKMKEVEEKLIQLIRGKSTQ